MIKRIKAPITAVHGWVSDDILTSEHFAKIINRSHDWIMARSGIVERRIAGQNMATSDMAAAAVKGLLHKKNLDPCEIDLLICATITPDMPTPATACIVADKVGAKNAFAFDLSAACSGFTYGLATAAQFIQTQMVKKAIVIAADKLSCVTNYSDDNCILFGDGAAVFKAAVSYMTDSVQQLLTNNQLQTEDIAWFIPHQVNKRIIDVIAEKLNFNLDKIAINVHKYGNTSAATIPLCLWEWEDKLKVGDKVILS